MDSIESLQRLVDAVEKAGANIAPTYQEYMPLAFAVANSCGEEGRSYFHRLCRLSDKYRPTEADRLYDRALKDGRRQNSLGTVWHLAELAGVKPDPKLANLQASEAPRTHPRACAEGGGAETATTGEADSLPCFPDYEWPAFLRQMVDCGDTAAQRDVLLLGGLTVIGATVNKLLCIPYGRKLKYPCLQTFVIAPPASGKGVVAWTRRLAEPVHDTCLTAYRQAMEAYRREHAQWECLGKEKGKTDEPQKPALKLFIIPGNNSGTGVVENLIDADGVGLICEAEADTVSSSIGADYGHWSDTLRNCFDHERLAFNRRTNHEYRECRMSLLSVLLSGTPAQVQPLIPSAENGLFSRQVFYNMPPICEWVDQFDTDDTDYDRRFADWGRQWERVLQAVRGAVGSICFELDEAQRRRFNERLARLFSQAGMAHGDTMKSSVARIAINLCRLMSLVALLRALDPLLSAGEEAEDLSALGAGDLTRRLLGCPGLRPCDDVPRENVADGVVSRLLLTVGAADFEAVLALADPLYRHACHVLSFLPAADVRPAPAAGPEILFDYLPRQFTRQEALEEAVRREISPNTLDSLLKRFTDRGLLQKTGRGAYAFCSHVRTRGRG